MNWLGLWERTHAAPVLARAQRSLIPLAGRSWRWGASRLGEIGARFAPAIPRTGSVVPGAALPVSRPQAEDGTPFLARWSRRKLAGPEEDAGTQPDDGIEPREAVAAVPEAEPALSDAPLPDLPALDAITADTNITGFLAKGVSQAVRNAALRRAWSLDPAIRDYVGDARDYAYDWNVPGGVPGFGAIDPSYDVEGTLSRMFSEPKPAEDEAVPAADIEPVPDALPHARDASADAGDHKASTGEADEVETRVSEPSSLASDPAQDTGAHPVLPPANPASGLEPPFPPATRSDLAPASAYAEPPSRGKATPRHGKATPA